MLPALPLVVFRMKIVSAALRRGCSAGVRSSCESSLVRIAAGKEPLSALDVFVSVQFGLGEI